MDSAVDVTEDEDVQRWITCCNDMVVVNAVSVVVGTSALQKLVEHFIARKEWMKAAKTEFAIVKMTREWTNPQPDSGQSL